MLPGLIEFSRGSAPLHLKPTGGGELQIVTSCRRQSPPLIEPISPPPRMWRRNENESQKPILIAVFDPPKNAKLGQAARANAAT
jgi:hypothetical protein